MEKQFIGISYENTNIGVLENIVIEDTIASTGTSIDVFGTDEHNLDIRNVLMSAQAASEPLAGIRIRQGSSVNIIGCDVIRHERGLFLAPDATKTVTSIYARSSFFDACSVEGVHLLAASGTTIHRISISGCWASSSGLRGIHLSGAGTVDGVSITDCRIMLNDNQGVLVTTGTNVLIANNQIAANSQDTSDVDDGIAIAAGVDEFMIVNNRIGSTSDPQKRGIQVVSGDSDNYSIIGNDLRGNTTQGLLDDGSGTNKQVHSNLPLEDQENFVLGGGAALTRHLSATATLDFDLTSVVTHELTITVTGAALNDTVTLGVPEGSVTADTFFWARVSSANTVTVQAVRLAGTPNPASGTFRVDVWKH